MKRERIQREKKKPPKDDEPIEDLPALTERLKEVRKHIREAREVIEGALKENG